MLLKRKLYYFDNGKIIETGNFKDGKKIGEWKYYDKNSQLSETKIH